MEYRRGRIKQRLPPPRRTDYRKILFDLGCGPILYFAPNPPMTKKPLGAVVPLIVLHRNGEKPLHRQIYDALRSMVLERRLQPGQQIPSSRALAVELGISRIPVLNA